MAEWQHAGVISQHFTHFILGESHHLVELRRQGIVGTDVETAGQIIHGYGTYSCKENSAQ